MKALRSAFASLRALLDPAAVRRAGYGLALPGLTALTLGLAVLAASLLGEGEAGRPRAVLALEPPAATPEDLRQLVENRREAPRVLPQEDGLRPRADPPASPRPRSGRTGPLITADGRVVLAPAPDLELVAEGLHGLLPIIGPDGRRPAEVYARPFDASDPRPRIAVLVGGMGLSQVATRNALDHLPPEISLAFSPHADGLQSWVNRARAQGHEILVEVPMEPFDFPDNDPGPYTLLTEAPASENLRRLEWVLSRFNGYIGLVNFEGGRFLASEAAVGPMLEVTGSRGLLFLDDGGAELSQAVRIGRSRGLEVARADRRIDRRLSRQAIDEQLLELELVARNQGVAIGIGLAYPVTVEEIAVWAPTLAAKGFALAPVSAALGAEPGT